MSKFHTHLAKLLLTAIVLTIVVGCGGRPNLADKTGRELYVMGMKKYDDKNYIEAIEIFQAVVFNHAGESMVDTALYHLGLSYYGNKDYSVAAVEFNRLALNYPASVYFENAIFMRAVCYYESTPGHYGLDQTELQKAIDQFEDFIIDFPESELIPEAQEFLKLARTKMARKYYESAVVYKRIGGYTASQKYFQIVIDDYTDTEYASLALFKHAELNMRLKKFVEAQAGFENFTIIFAEHELAPEAKKLARQAAFKSGELSFEQGKLDTAKERFESFIKDYPDDERIGEAKKYLNRIQDQQSLLTEDGHADS